MLSRWRPRPIKDRVRERQPITEWHQSISLKSRLSGPFAESFIGCSNYAVVGVMKIQTL